MFMRSPSGGYYSAGVAAEEPAQFLALSLGVTSEAGRDGYFQRMNPAADRTFGYTQAELEEQPFTTFVHPDDRGAIVAELDRLAHGQPSRGFEHRFRFRDGTYRWLSWVAVATPEAVVYASARDVTQRHCVDSQRALERAAGAAQTDGFLVSVSHDLQQPLTVIKGQAQVLQRKLARGESVETERLGHSLNYINAAVVRMDDMIHELLDAAVEAAGRPLTLMLSPVDLIALTRQTIIEHQLAFELHEFRLEAEPRALVAMLDRARMLRVLGNLLSNAIKYSPDGGPIRVRVGQVQADHGPMAEIVVQDEGLGIPPGDLHRIFDRFQRGSNVVNRIAGTGLGLAGVRKMVEMHGGSIGVDSQEGVGSTFTLELPMGGPHREVLTSY
jgi:PAS domain S-box-containing protein